MADHMTSSGHTISYEALSPDIDAAFHMIYDSYFSDHHPSWLAFEQSAHEYLCAPHSSDEHDAFFRNLSHVWLLNLQSGKHKAAELVWSRAISVASACEEESDVSIHKGTPYYFWAMTAILRGDVDRGYALAHKAFEEDRRKHPDGLPPLPAVSLVRLDASHTDQALQQWVQRKANLLNNLISSTSSSLTYQAVNDRFLKCTDVLEEVFVLSYVLARLVRMSDCPLSSTVWRSMFASQIRLNLLFDLAQVVDGAIGRKCSAISGKQPTFFDRAKDLAKASSCTTQQDLERTTTNAREIGPNQALAELLSEVATAGRSLRITYLIRNHAAHSVQPLTAVEEHWDGILAAVFDVLFLTIKTFY